MLILLFVALWFILRGDLLYVFPCVILFLCISVLLVLRLPRLGKRELISVLFVRLFGLCLFRFVGFPFLLGSEKGCDFAAMSPRRTSYRVYISQLIRFARAFSNLSDFNCRKKALTAKLLRQGYRYFKLRKAFSKFYCRHSALVEKYSVSQKNTSATRYIGTRILQ